MLQFGIQEITPAAVARMLSIMVKTTSGLVEPISLQVIPGVPVALLIIQVFYLLLCTHFSPRNIPNWPVSCL